ncbi:MAG: type I DNA topoisomerase [Anaerolineae bacterium]|nr:type I DNA topoisomerase [Anaerolineae bacterium]MDH7475308.1 type I DNA topoisomerase [Anaerolineae bacterium]
MSDEPIVAYCVKCKDKREMRDPQALYMENGTPATRGVCPVCGTSMFRMGRTPAHNDLPPYEPPSKDGRLVIVESPAKARTVGRFLGKDYTVRASVGHVRDLLRSKLSVDVDDDFKPRYRIPNEKKKVVKELKQEVRQVAEVYLATDPDREGEAIAWHLMAAAGITRDQARRVVFHEITKDAIEHAFAHPSEINMDLVNAQQARRILDRLVGYQISPLLWERVRNRLTAGRVQSVAVRLIVEREREIQNFVPVEYWSVEAELAKQEDLRRKKPRSFTAKLYRIRGQEVDLKNQADTQAIVNDLETAVYVIANIKRGTRKRNPSAPYTTSTMQQEASRRLGFTAKRTMAVAQQLYMGLPVGEEGEVGLITYMRTDSTNVAELAQEEARRYISERFGKKFMPTKPPQYKTKAKGAQEAHEAIRPTSVFREPDAIKEYLTRDQYRLYNLIWQRFLASQMSPAEMDTVSLDIAGVPQAELVGGQVPESSLREITYHFRASGSNVKFPGFLVIYEEARDEDAVPGEEEVARIFPPLDDKEVLALLRLMPEQHFTQPPPRYSEATLVRTLEEYGIGRPSTYAPIITTIQNRGYVVREGGRLYPTETGFLVNDILVKHFPDILDYGFTARMEEELDEIAAGERDWVKVLHEFYKPFSQTLERARQEMEYLNLGDQPTGEMCELCGHPLVVKWGRYGKFVACSNYPACRNTKSFYVSLGVKCPQCGGELAERRTRKGRIFYGCLNYPECEFTTWDRPLPTPCPTCGGLLTEGRKGLARCVNCGAEVELETLPEEELAEAEA